MDDVAALADRVILIDRGSVRFDGSLPDLSSRFGDGRRLIVVGPGEVLRPLGFTDAGRGRWSATVDKQGVNGLLTKVLAELPGADVTVSEPPLEDILRTAFGAHRADDAAAADEAP
jgi:ABC-2 type transport system ATP-binding protein